MGNFPPNQSTGVFTFIGLIAVLFFVFQIVQANRLPGESQAESTLGERDTFLAATAVVPEPSDPEQRGTEEARIFPGFENLPTLNDNSLAPNPIPLTYQAKSPLHTFQIHQVSRGETPNLIADQYGISAEMDPGRLSPGALYRWIAP